MDWNRAGLDQFVLHAVVIKGCLLNNPRYETDYGRLKSIIKNWIKDQDVASQIHIY